MRHTNLPRMIPAFLGILLFFLLCAAGCDRIQATGHPSGDGTSVPTASDFAQTKESDGTSEPACTQETTDPDDPSRPSDPPDNTPPVITGQDFEIEQGEGVSYRKQVSVTDDTDPAPVLEIDNSAVDLDTPGVYPVIYTATDRAGNTSTLTLMLTVKPRLVEGANEAYVLHLASEILDEITDDSMTKLEKAFKIWRWTRNHIVYADDSDKTDWYVGAYDGFTRRKGDCYTYYAVSKALLTAAGIDNVDVVRDIPPGSVSRHYWLLVNTGEGWYHFDSTVYYKGADPTLFMLTDEELKAWDKKYYKKEHNYSPDGLPEVSKASIQYRVDYNTTTIKDE